MTGRIQREIKQSTPIGSLEEEAYLNVQRTANALSDEIGDLLRAHQLTPPQYNVLRILRGAGERGLTASDIGERMITRDPDVTRLVDRLEKRGLVERWRCTEDRRVVWTRISPAGLEALQPLDAPLHELHVGQLAHLGEEKLRTLVALLEEARDRA
ncbi:MarR family transcriptional regulator [Longimicrobium sp.]|uniref:MarR family winged helix-turn-helix transcriptional regulator n=1 Tax=Longimicrobium sp. TaxID=2029185 RepID=UPI002E3049BB|nr:MarR family transcriptional regulator [Longimicrobium sp.]HEX6042722.1 MarR family transcriptional regulator [Longimicrobium sp.]